MKVNVDKGTLEMGIGATLGVVDRRGTMPILSNCLVEATSEGLVISATDLETTFKGFYPAVVTETGAFTVPAHTFMAVVKDFPQGDVEITSDERQITLESGDSRYRFNTFPPDQFPPIRAVPEGLTEIEAPPLVEMIDKVLFSVGEDLQYHLTGVLWEMVGSEDGPRLRMVSTDGHRLSVTERPLEGLDRLGNMDEGRFIPAKAVREIKRFVEAYAQKGKVGLFIDERTIYLKAEDRELTVRLLERKFPEYRRIIPESFEAAFTFNRKELAAILKRLSLLSTERFKGILFKLNGKTALLDSDNPEIGHGKETLEVLEMVGTLPGSEEECFDGHYTTGFNCRYLMEPMATMTGETVVMDALKDRPAKLTDPGDPTTFYLIMPMTL